MKVRVWNLCSPRTNREVPNQFVIQADGCLYFQSYETLIAKKCGDKVYVTPMWDYSRTTAKYFYEFLRKYTQFYVTSKKEVEILIADGFIKEVESL